MNVSGVSHGENVGEVKHGGNVGYVRHGENVGDVKHADLDDRNYEKYAKNVGKKKGTVGKHVGRMVRKYEAKNTEDDDRKSEMTGRPKKI